MALMMIYLTESAPSMGNPILVPAHTTSLEQLGSLKLPTVSSMVPFKMMAGFSNAPMKYSIGRFTYEGRGSKVQINMSDHESNSFFGSLKEISVGSFRRHIPAERSASIRTIQRPRMANFSKHDRMETS